MARRKRPEVRGNPFSKAYHVQSRKTVKRFARTFKFWNYMVDPGLKNEAKSQSINSVHSTKQLFVRQLELE